MAGKKINLTDQLKNYFGFDTFKGNQEAIIQNLLAGNDTFVLMPTGGGKSLCYQLPSLLMDGTAIVISPLIALMKNQVDAMRNFSEEDGIAHFINSSLNKSAIDQVKSDILAGRTKLLYVAPELHTFYAMTPFVIIRVNMNRALTKMRISLRMFSCLIHHTQKKVKALTLLN